MPVAGLNTGSTNNHAHLLLNTGRTSINDKHSHTWKTGAKRTGQGDKHTHALPQTPKRKKTRAKRK